MKSENKRKSTTPPYIHVSDAFQLLQDGLQTELFRRPLPLLIYYFSKKYCRRLSLNRLKYIIPSDLVI